MQMELDLQLEDRGEGGINGSLDFSTDLYTPESASRMAGHLQVRGTPATAFLRKCTELSWLQKMPVAMPHIYEVSLCRHCMLLLF